MREISNTLSDVIFTACPKIIDSAKFDKTYKCRVISKIADNKYMVQKDGISHIVTSNGVYSEDDIVYVLLPENNWINAIILPR